MAAKLNSALVSTLILAIIVLIILFNVLGDTADDINTAAGNLSSGNTSTTSGEPISNVLPLTSFFKAKGVILLAFIAGIVIAVIVGVMALSKTK